MTIDELKAIPFHFVCSAAWEHEHTMTYESEDGRLGFCDHTPKRKNGDFGKGYRHWHIYGKGYLVSDRVVERRLEAERIKEQHDREERDNAQQWELSDREKAIIESLNQNK